MSLARHSLPEERLWIAVPTGHTPRDAQAAAAGELRNEPFVLYPRGNGSLLYDCVIIAACQHAGFSPSVIQEAPQLASIVSLVAAGVGVTLAPIGLPAASHRRPLISASPARRRLAMLWLVARRGVLLSSAATTFCTMLNGSSRRLRRRSPATALTQLRPGYTCCVLGYLAPIYWTTGSLTGAIVGYPTLGFGRGHMRNWRAIAVATTAVCVLFVISVFTAGPTFRADYRFTGTALTGFKPIGQADWKVQNGEIVGTPKDASGGWLLLDGKEFQDTQMYASVKCARRLQGRVPDARREDA